jgi:methylase of polypeptide subunit release factors
LNLLATWFPNSSFVGIDLSEEAIKFARAEAEQRGNNYDKLGIMRSSAFEGHDSD